MQDAAIVTTRMPAASYLLFKKSDGGGVKRSSKSSRNIHADHTAADDDKVRNHGVPTTSSTVLCRTARDPLNRLSPSEYPYRTKIDRACTPSVDSLSSVAR